MEDIRAELGLDVFKNDKETHIKIDQQICRDCRQRYCLYVCPAGRYTEGEGGEISFDFEGCLECGTCMIACPNDALHWDYPRGGFGIQLRFG